MNTVTPVDDAGWIETCRQQAIELLRHNVMQTLKT